LTSPLSARERSGDEVPGGERACLAEKRLYVTYALDRDLAGGLDRLERDPEGRLVVVDLKTAARKHTDLQVEASLQLSIYSYATSMNGWPTRRISASASTS